jgi:hypothetical protein
MKDQGYRTVCTVPLVKLEGFCRSLDSALAHGYEPQDVTRHWHLYVSGECPRCGIWIAGDELHALAQPPNAELATVKIGRMRLGYCARAGCESPECSLHFWQQEGIDWSAILILAEDFENEAAGPQKAPSMDLRAFAKNVAPFAVRFAGAVGCILMLFVARQLYQGGRIPFFREPENFQLQTVPDDTSWPTPLSYSE